MIMIMMGTEMVHDYLLILYLLAGTVLGCIGIRVIGDILQYKKG